MQIIQRFGLIVFAVCMLLGVGFWRYLSTKTSKAPVHYHAGFQIYIDGVLQDYSSDQFMHAEVCSLNPPTEDPTDKAHLHDNVGDVVHVHQNGATWGDLFNYLHVRIDSTASEAAYINSQLVADISQQPIKPYESLVLLIGTHGYVNDYLAHQVTYQHIVEVEHQSESCGNP